MRPFFRGESASFWSFRRIPLKVASETRLGVAIADDDEVSAVVIDDPAIDGEFELDRAVLAAVTS